MKRLLAAILFSALAVGVLAPLAQADPSDYGLETAEAAVSTGQAGGHPDLTIAISMKREPNNELPAPTRDTIFELPPGLLANPTAVPVCSLAQFISTDVNSNSNATGCPQGAQVGITEIDVFNKGGSLRFSEPVYNLEPKPGEPARLGFFATSFPIVIDTRLRSESDYGATAAAEGVSALVPLLSADTAIWAVPAAESHDAQRITPFEAIHNSGAPETPSGKRPSGLVPKPFVVNPTRCGVAQGVSFAADSYAAPGVFSKAFAPLGMNFGCESLDFTPTLSVAPTTAQTEAGSGLDVKLTFPSEGFEHDNLNAEAAQRRVEVTLPAGVAINPSQAVGLGACSPDAFAREASGSHPGEGCPENSKVGSVTARSPLLEETAEGSLFGALIALYLVLKVPDRGVVVKLPGRVVPDPQTGQLVTTFGEAPYEIPQLPVSSFELHFREGARSPLIMPPSCGTYTSSATFTSWAGQVVTTHPDFQISRGVDGGACPGDPRPFGPGFSAGTLSNSAGTYSPFYMRFTRRDGDQELRKFSSTLPPGVAAKLAGVAYCPEGAIASAAAKSGAAELVAPSCPAASRVGHLEVGAGVGAVLTYTTGSLYLAGPYRGAPLSVAAIVPAIAGPFDIGTVVTRVPLRVNPRTAVVTADGASGDPLPRILAGIPLKLRDVRVHIDRSKFTFNPTSCDRLQTTAELFASGGDLFSTADDSRTSLAARFQAANCSRLGFKPRLSLKLIGAAQRGGNPALRGVFRPRPGDANLSGMVLRLPRSAFLDQGHIRTICTRVQFAADACPKKAAYGHAKAFTPLLDEPLSGPVYLRSSTHELPDFVADLHGTVDVEAVAKIDSVDGALRATFTKVPDAPLSKVIVSMQGAGKGLIENSTNLCRGEQRAEARLTAHNAKRQIAHPVTQVECGRKHPAGHKHPH
jgi:hypothetical protein